MAAANKILFMIASLFTLMRLIPSPILKGNPVPVRRGRRGALRAHPSGAQALCLPSAQAGEQGAGAALSGSHDGLFTATVDPSGAAVLGHRSAHQALPSAGTGLCPKVHGGRCGAFGRDRRPARHALGTRHQAFDAARSVGLLGHPLCAAGVYLAHLYNLRAAAGYRARRQHWAKTRPTGIPIGERRAPQPDGHPGYLRIDSVHQGDEDGVKGVDHINVVDCVTQWEVVATCERLSEAYLLPVIEALLDNFPFSIRGFHADNGSEYINHRVARLLEKLRIEFTKSRPRHSNDNGLAETKNGAIVRKCFGYSHIPQRFAKQINAFCAAHLNPYLNFHRPCLFAEDTIDATGKVKKRYPQRLVMTPLEKLASLPDPDTFLKPGITLAQLQAEATRLTDNDAAQQLNEARRRLFQSIHHRSKCAA